MKPKMLDKQKVTYWLIPALQNWGTSMKKVVTKFDGVQIPKIS